MDVVAFSVLHIHFYAATQGDDFFIGINRQTCTNVMHLLHPQQGNNQDMNTYTLHEKAKLLSCNLGCNLTNLCNTSKKYKIKTEQNKKLKFEKQIKNFNKL